VQFAQEKRMTLSGSDWLNPTQSGWRGGVLGGCHENLTPCLQLLQRKARHSHIDESSLIIGARTQGRQESEGAFSRELKPMHRQS
jgi:hypothetical protein